MLSSNFGRKVELFSSFFYFLMKPSSSLQQRIDFLHSNFSKFSLSIGVQVPSEGIKIGDVNELVACIAYFLSTQVLFSSLPIDIKEGYQRKPGVFLSSSVSDVSTIFREAFRDKLMISADEVVDFPFMTNQSEGNFLGKFTRKHQLFWQRIGGC